MRAERYESSSASYPALRRSAPPPAGAPGGDGGCRQRRPAPPGTAPHASASPCPYIGHGPRRWSWCNAPARMAWRRGLAPDHRLPCSPLGRRRPPAACRPAGRQQWLPSPCGPSSARPKERWSMRKPWWAVVVWTGERERMRMTAAMAGAAVYIAMVGGGGTDVWRRSSRLGNRVSLMWAADGRTDVTCVI